MKNRPGRPPRSTPPAPGKAPLGAAAGGGSASTDVLSAGNGPGMIFPASASAFARIQKRNAASIRKISTISRGKAASRKVVSVLSLPYTKNSSREFVSVFSNFGANSLISRNPFLANIFSRVHSCSSYPPNSDASTIRARSLYVADRRVTYIYYATNKYSSRYFASHSYLS